MSRTIINVISFKVGCEFEEWVKNFDSKEADRRNSQFDIETLLRITNRDNLKKVICINKTLQVNIKNFVQTISEWIKTHNVDFLVMEGQI